MSIHRRTVDKSKLNRDAALPYDLRLIDFESAMQDVYDFFYDVNLHLTGKGLNRLEDTLRKANLSGTVSDMLTASVAAHSRTLVQNRYHNGHPDLLVRGLYPDDSAKAGGEGVEIKCTRKKGGAVDTHGAREQWMCVFVYQVDPGTEPVADRVASQVHRGVHRPCGPGGLSPQRPGRTRHPDCDSPCRRGGQAAPELGLPRS